MSTADADADRRGWPRSRFDDELRAVELMTAMTRLAREEKLRIIDAVFVVKDEDGRPTSARRPTCRPGQPRSAPACGAGCSD